ncbi:MAG: PAS domain S-box protein [Desulfuromonadaceae bacterium]|nr:PAS domain S-box protein [Desulfuromonadaceae bacterium]MDD2849266.1 PAS domain S-box protein [Desulfuromonadaceae bacterium]MDD4131893.1 PAS domain S-box protein [Desulfuromonadaceae bacterium]
MNSTVKQLKRYSLALVFVAASYLLRVSIEKMVGPGLPPFITFYPSIMIATLVAGLGPGLLTIAVSGVLVDYLILTPRQIGNWSSEEAAILLLYASIGFLMTWFAHRYRKIKEGLETLVIERTEKLNRAKNEWERTFDSVPDLIALLDEQHRVIRVNRSMANKLKREPIECIGLKYAEVILGTSSPPDSCPHAQTMCDLTEHESQVEDTVFGGTYLVTSTPLLDSNLNLYASVHVARDITLLKQAENSLRESEERLALAASATQIGIFDWNMDKGGILWTQTHAVIFGYVSASAAPSSTTSTTEHDYHEWTDRIHPEDLPLVEAELHRCMQEGKPVEVHFRVVWADGSIHWVECKGAFLNENGGKSTRMLGIVMDITERKLAEELLRESEVRLRFHMENSPMAVIEWGKDFCITRWTGESERMFGWSAAEVLGRPLADLKMVFEDDIPIVENTVAQLTKGEVRQVVATNRNYTKSGDVRHCTWYNSVLTDSDGEVRSVFSKVIDITEQKRAEEALKRVHEQLELRVVERTEQLAKTVETLLGEIASREKAEKSLVRLNKLYAVLTETNQVLVRAAGRDSIFRDFCRIAVEHGGFLLAWVGFVDYASGRIRVAASHGATAYLEDMCLTINEEPAGYSTTGISVRKGTHYIYNDFQNDPCTLPWHERGKAHGIHSSAAIALKEDGKVVGALTLYAGEKNFFDQQHVELLQQMGEDVSFALDYLRQEELRSHSEQALREETLERLRTVEELRRQEQLLIQQSRQAAMGEMIGNIAHQWRQPLNTLGLYTQRLGYFYGSPCFTKEFLDASVAKSNEIIQYMSRTIDDFRNFFSTEQDKSDFTADEAVKKVLSLVEANFKEHRIRVEIVNKKATTIHGFPNEYAQVLLNILINAKDALIERTIESPCLKITLDGKNGKSLVTVSDNAGGIPDDIIDKIFDPYFSTKGPQQGTGVGLFMCKNIIENKMSGKLSVRNSDKGAEFRIEV